MPRPTNGFLLLTCFQIRDHRPMRRTHRICHTASAASPVVSHHDVVDPNRRAFGEIGVSEAQAGGRESIGKSRPESVIDAPLAKRVEIPGDESPPAGAG